MPRHRFPFPKVLPGHNCCPDFYERVRLCVSLELSDITSWDGEHSCLFIWLKPTYFIVQSIPSSLFLAVFYGQFCEHHLKITTQFTPLSFYYCIGAPGSCSATKPQHLLRREAKPSLETPLLATLDSVGTPRLHQGNVMLGRDPAS